MLAMRKIFTVLLAVVSIGTSGSVLAQNYLQARQAYIDRDYATALRELRFLAERGHHPAQTDIGIMYEFGQGVIKDKVYAYMWWNIAATNGSRESGRYRDEIEQRMTAAEIARAQELARECVKKQYKDC
jgi:TPR repeat protein